MVLGIASAFGAADADAGLQIQYAVTPRSLFVAFAIGGLLTLLVVAVLRLARERDDDLDRDPQPSRAAAFRTGADSSSSALTGSRLARC